ncbi:MAG TPA: hypothetical protein PL070_16200 [Flavobacteriales bacterium]|nr:hypothetical protein [Flavobacteriales bacterium]
MGRLVMVIGLLALFLGWALYRLLVKRDLMQHRGTLAVGALFIGVWALLYFWLWS